MKQKILIVLGSPRKKGNSATLAGKVSEGAQANGGSEYLSFAQQYVGARVGPGVRVLS